MPFTSKVKNKVLSGQSREIVSNVLKFMQAESVAAGNGEENIPLAKVQERVAAATGVSIRNIRRIKNEAKLVDTGHTTIFSTPNKKRPDRKLKTHLDEADLGVLRRTIINHHVTERKVPTLKTVHKKFVEDMEYQGCKESLRKEIHKIGFRWRKLKNNRKILMEQQPIRMLRIEFLRRMRQYRGENRPIIYMDETYIHSTHTHTKGWSDESMEGLQKPISKGPRLIIVHAGGENGFVPNAYIRWKSTSTSGDYHHDMNYDNYKKWVSEKLIPNLPQNSVVVIDNAPYHNKQIDKAPTTLTRKAEMEEWLRLRNIDFDKKLLKPQLYNIIKMHKPKYKRYEIDDLFNRNGHEVLRLPPYHPDLNPIELVWAEMKEYVAKRNVDFNFNKVIEYCDNFFEEFPVEKWNARCERAKRFEQEFIDKEPTIDIVAEELIIRLGEDSDSESDMDGTDDDDDHDDVNDGDLSGIEEICENDEDQKLLVEDNNKTYFSL